MEVKDPMFFSCLQLPFDRHSGNNKTSSGKYRVEHVIRADNYIVLFFNLFPENQLHTSMGKWIIWVYNHNARFVLHVLDNFNNYTWKKKQ